jgi:hypothetical protein
LSPRHWRDEAMQVFWSGYAAATDLGAPAAALPLPTHTRSASRRRPAWVG